MEWKGDSQINVTIYAGQSYSIVCELTTTNNQIKKCFKFGITHHNQSYEIENVLFKSHNPDPLHSISYTGLNITHATVNDTGLYSCYYKEMFARSSTCPNQFKKNFNIVVKGKSFTLA